MSTNPSSNVEDVIQRIAAFIEAMHPLLLERIGRCIDRLGPHEIAAVISDGSRPKQLENSSRWPYEAGAHVGPREQLIEVLAALRFADEQVARQVPGWLAELRSEPASGLRMVRFVVCDGMLMMVPFTFPSR